MRASQNLLRSFEQPFHKSDGSTPYLLVAQKMPDRSARRHGRTIRNIKQQTLKRGADQLAGPSTAESFEACNRDVIAIPQASEAVQTLR